MTNVVQEMTHPMIEEMQVRYEREIAELRSGYEDKIEKLEGRIEEAEYYVDQQRGNLYDVIEYAKKERKEGRKVSKEKLYEEIKKGRRIDSDWNVLDDIYDLIDSVDYEVQWETKTETRIVYQTPPELKEAIKNLQELI